MADCNEDVMQEESKTQNLRRQLDDLGYNHLALGPESVPLVEKLLSDLIQAKAQKSSGHLEVDQTTNHQIQCSDQHDQGLGCNTSHDNHQATSSLQNNQNEACGGQFVTEPLDLESFVPPEDHLDNISHKESPLEGKNMVKNIM